MGQQVHGLYQQTDGNGRVEAEGFVADYTDVRQVGGHVVGYLRDELVAAHEDGYVARRSTAGQQTAYLVGQTLEGRLTVAVGRQQLDADAARRLALGRHLLLHVGVGMAQLVGTRGVLFAQPFVLLARGLGKEGVVEQDDVALGTVVGLQGLHGDHLLSVCKLAVDGVEQSPVARAPAVDALLHVAHDEVLGLLVAHAFLQQQLEVLPLHRAGVLEFVNHDILQLSAYLLEDEGGVAVADKCMQQLLRVAEQEAVGLVVQLANLLLDAVQQAQLAEVAQRQVGRLVQPVLAGALVDGIAQYRHQGCLGQHVYLLGVLALLAVPFRRVAHAVEGALAHGTLVHLPVAQLQEETGHACLTVVEVVDRQPFAVEGVEERLGNLLHPFTGILAYLAQLLTIGLDEAGRAYLLLERLAMFLIIIAEDGLAELLHLSDDVP